MAAPKRVDLLPKEVREELERRIEAQGFRNYQALSDWLKGEGYSISVAALQRFGVRHRERLESMPVVVQPAGESEVSLMALQRVQGALLVIKKALERGDELDAREIALLSRSLTELIKGMIALLKYHQDIPERGQGAGGRRLDPETIRIIKEEIYGIL